MNVQIDKTRVAAALRKLQRTHYQWEIARKLKASQAEVSLLLNKQKEGLRDHRLDRLAEICECAPYELLAPPLRKLVDQYSVPF